MSNLAAAFAGLTPEDVRSSNANESVGNSDKQKSTQEPTNPADMDPKMRTLLAKLASGDIPPARIAFSNVQEARLNAHILGKPAVAAAYNIAIKALERERDTAIPSAVAKNSPPVELALPCEDLSSYLDIMLPHSYELQHLVKQLRGTPPSLLLTSLRASVHQLVTIVEETQEVAIRSIEILASQDDLLERLPSHHLKLIESKVQNRLMRKKSLAQREALCQRRAWTVMDILSENVHFYMDVRVSRLECEWYLLIVTGSLPGIEEEEPEWL